MYINNLFRLKDWKIEEFLLLIITVQTIFFVLILLDYVGLDIPILKDVIGFFFILFIPGTLLLRLINLDRIKSDGQIFLYTIGSSLVILMLIGFLMNYLYPFIGIDKPLSFVSIIITLNVFTISLCFLCYFLDKREANEKKSPQNKVDLKNLVSSPLLFPFIIPILSILGAYLMNTYQFNVLTILMIFLICFIAFVVSLGSKIIPSKLYPLIVFSISISLLLHKSLITNYIWGWDINNEYFLAQQVISYSFWNESLPFNYNSMLSVVMLGPILSSFINIGEIWIMKIIYPFLFSLVPVGLYYIFCKQTNPKIAFFSVFFFMIMFTYYTEMLSLIRQQVAEIMLVLVLMLIVSDQVEITKRSFLSVMFGMSIVVTHYGLTYVMMLILIISAIFLYFLDKNLIQALSRKYWPKIYQLTALTAVLQSFPDHLSGISKYESRQESRPSVSERIKLYRPNKKERIITSSFIVLFIFFLFTWYIYTSSSSIFYGTVNIGQSMIGSLYSFMDPNTTQGLSMVIEQQITPLRNFHKYIYLISQFFIFIGVLALFFRKDGMNFIKEYKALSLATFVVLVVGILLPFFSSQMNTTRLYHVAVIIIAPFIVLGIMKIFDLFKLIRINISKDHQFKFIAIFFIVFLLFDTGVVYQLLDNAHPTSIALSSSYDFPKFNQKETAAGEWLASGYNAYGHYHNYTVYGDKNRASVLNSMIPTEEIPPYYDLITNRSYIFLGTTNLDKGKVLVYKMVGSNILVDLNYKSDQLILKPRSKIYDNGGSAIYGEVNSMWS
jgi:uncharacterized membrane protein